MPFTFESSTVAELRSILVASGKFTEEEADALKGKTNIVYEIKKLEKEGVLNLEELNHTVPPPTPVSTGSENDMLENMFEEASPENIPVPLKVSVVNDETRKTPRITDPEWQEYVLSQLTKEEFFKGNPKVAGLRRVAEKLLGEITFNGPITVWPALSEDTNGRASILYKLEIAWRHGCPYITDLDKGLPTRVFHSCAEACDRNVQPGIYQTFPLTIAETRAEGRALRKALQIAVCTAEEVGGEMPTETTPVVQEWNSEDKASSQQINSLTMMSERVGVDLGKLVPELNKLTRQKAADLLKDLNSYQTGTPVPDNLKVANKE